MKSSIIFFLFSCFVITSLSLNAQNTYCTDLGQRSGNNYNSKVKTTTDVGNISNINYSKSYNNNNAYADISATQKITQYAGLPFEFEHVFSNHQIKYSLGVWIDWNNDTTFQSTELVHSSDKGTPSPRTETILIDQNQTTGMYRMRVRVLWETDISLLDPCSNMGNVEGAVLDFTVEVLPAPSCWPITAITLGDRTNTTATFSWTDSHGGTAWDIAWGTTPDNNDAQEIGIITNITTPTETITGLDVDQTYDVYVRTNCGTGDYSVWEKYELQHGYCVPFQKTANSYAVHVTTTTDVEDISNINFTKQYNANEAYENLTTTQKVTQYAGLDFTVSTKFPGYTPSSSNNLIIWVDWNNNMLFETSEIVHTSHPSSLLTQTQVVPIAANQTPGIYRMRLRYINKQNLNATSLDPCIDLFDQSADGQGAVLDFTVEVLGSCITNVGTISGGEDEVCEQDTTAEFTNTVTGTWSITNGTGTAELVGSNTNQVKGLTAGTVTLVYTVTSNGCSDTAMKDITVKARPDVTLPSNQTTCLGTTVTLTANGATTYVWDNGTTDAQQSVSPATETTYSVIGTGANGCTNSASTTVSVIDKTYPLFASISSVCVGADAPLLPTVSTNNVSGTWSPQTVNTATANTQSYTFTPTNTTCTADTTITISVNSIPTVTLSPSKTTICLGENVTLTAGGAVSYSWNNGITGNGSIQTVSPSSNTNYNVVGTDANGCTNFANVSINVSLPIEVSIVGVDTITVNGTQLYAGIPAGGTWTFIGNDIADFQNGFLTPIISGHVTITYSVDDSSSCNSTSTATKTVFISPSIFGATSVDDIDPVSISLFPNPATNEVSLQFTLSEINDITIKVIDLNGKVIETQSFNNATTGANSITLNVSNYANGIYSVVLQSNETLTTKKLVINK